MVKLARSIAIFALVLGMPTAAWAQAASPPLLAPPPAAVQSTPAQPQKADHQDGCPCPCCQMMEKQGGDTGCMQKMKMMKGQGAQEKPAAPQEHDKH